MNEYYVYGLIDPRTETVFYIGKGKGKRITQHLNEKENIHSNTGKLNLIKEIQKSNYEVTQKVFAEKLSEEAALLLEKILIFRFGRKIFDEGILTNIVPGGKWHKEAPLFITAENLPSEQYINEKFPEVVDVLKEYPYQAKEFIGLNCPKNPTDKMLYVYNNDGEKIHEWDISYFIQIFGLGHALDLINVIKNTNFPIYAWNRCWSKTKYLNLPKSSQLPLQDLDVINIDFLSEVNECIQNENTQILKCINANGNDLINAYIKPNEVTFECFFNNGQIKHSTTCVNGKLNGVSKKWYPSGQIQEIIEYQNNASISRTTYYESGNQEILEIQNDEGISRFLTKHFYENGQIRFENDNQGNTFSYFPNGQISSKSIMHEDIRNGGHVLIYEYSENGNIIKETKNYYTDGLLHGYEKSFFDTGEIRREIDYTNGYNNKIIKTFKKNGEVSIK
jgi:antitoxin component YwqK of YwqJK toxin-antitoxin module